MKILKLLSIAALSLGLFGQNPHHEMIIRTDDGGAVSLPTTKYYHKRATNNHQLDTPDGGKLTLFTVHTNKRQTDIVLSKTNPQGNEEWVKYYGGKGYDYASDLIATRDGGYLILGETSSYGNGNNDIYIVKITELGVKQWQNTFGDKYNEYGKSVRETEYGYYIYGTRQDCSADSDDPTPDCLTLSLIIKTDQKGKQLYKGDVGK